MFFSSPSIFYFGRLYNRYCTLCESSVLLSHRLILKIKAFEVHLYCDINIIQWRKNNWCDRHIKKGMQFYITSPLIFKAIHSILQSIGILYFCQLFLLLFFLGPQSSFVVFPLCGVSTHTLFYQCMEGCFLLVCLAYPPNIFISFSFSVFSYNW